MLIQRSNNEHIKQRGKRQRWSTWKARFCQENTVFIGVEGSLSLLCISLFFISIGIFFTEHDQIIKVASHATFYLISMDLYRMNSHINHLWQWNMLIIRLYLQGSSTQVYKLYVCVCNFVLKKCSYVCLFNIIPLSSLFCNRIWHYIVNLVVYCIYRNVFC